MAQAAISLQADGLSVELDGSGSTGTITGYFWSYSDSNGDIGATAEHTFASAGAYTVTLTVVDADTSISQASVTVIVSASDAGTVDVRDFGADPLGVLDATDEINAASDAAKAAGAVLVGLGGTFKIGGTVNLKTHCDFLGSVFVGDVGVSLPVIRIADDALFLKRLRNKWMRLPKVSKDRFTNLVTVGGNSTWPNDDDGVLIEGLSRSIVYFDEIEFCRNGLHILDADTSDVDPGTGGGVTGTDFCQFFLTNINGCQSNLWLDSRQRAAGFDSGWINENAFYGGSLRHEGVAMLVDGPIPGVYQIRLTGWGSAEGFSTPNHNSFHRISVEGNAHEWSIWCEGHQNHFDDLRWERFGTYPTDKIFVGKPAGTPAWMGGWGNRFSGFTVEKFTDPLDNYGHIVLGIPGASPNYAWSPRQIGRADDLGGGWVELVDTAP